MINCNHTDGFQSASYSNEKKIKLKKTTLCKQIIQTRAAQSNFASINTLIGHINHELQQFRPYLFSVSLNKTLQKRRTNEQIKQIGLEI